MNCRTVVPWLEPFVDGELSPEKVVEVEQHVQGCRVCAERVRLGQAFRSSLRRVSEPLALPSDAFRERLKLALEAAREREWEAHVVARQAESNRMLSWRTILPVAAAAGFTLFWAASDPSSRRLERNETASHANASVVNADQVIEQLIDHHVHDVPQASDLALLPSDGAQFEREVGVPVRIPSLKQYGGLLEGGTVVPVHNNQRAASLRYKVSGHRVTLYVYDPSRVPLEQRLEKRLVANAPVYVGARRGYWIGATERAGVGYALASDLNDAETAELVAALR
ncbi:MAG TPA: zf-HC2 domain-containing protein [Polyangiaceae bacterium]|nr:zf-HC2 domain-containing protein [Polyangiaceae bacterium]